MLQGTCLGKSSCLGVVLDMIDMDHQGTYKLPVPLHTACVKVINALWVDRKISAMQVSGNVNRIANMMCSLCTEVETIKELFLKYFLCFGKFFS